MSETATPAAAPAIRRLSIERFRGIKSLTWYPESSVNIILGGGDVGKTTLLDAVALLFSPVNSISLSDTDYHARNIAAGFAIEAIVSLSPGSGIGGLFKPSWPWGWNGKDASVPNIEDSGAAAGDPVYRLRVRGTEDLELVYEIVQPDGSLDSFPVALRRSIGLVRLSGDDRNDRDLRLVQGSALDRLLTDKSLRSRMASELAKSDIRNELNDAGKKALEDLDEAFAARSLPDGLDLAITGGQGPSIASLVGLTAKRDGTTLPLASWGAGTRRLAALAIAERNQGEAPITIVDEVERGLEPYRQRMLMEKLEAGRSQTFVTTHSPSAIAASSQATIWYVDGSGAIGALNAEQIARHRKIDPEAFLARLAIAGEGITEVGFITRLLERAFGTGLEQHGIRVTDGGGHEKTLGLLEALAAGGLSFGGFVDDENKHPERWARLGTKLDKLLFRWPAQCTESNVIAAIPDDELEALIDDPDGVKAGTRRRHLALRLGIDDKDFASLKAASGESLRAVIIEAARGVVPTGKEAEKNEYKSHASAWFKSLDGGRELADKVISLGAWPQLKSQLLPFCNAVRVALGLPPADDILP
ncbi:MAG TPA: AAA family ATPase [Rhizomicrobium sp.]